MNSRKLSYDKLAENLERWARQRDLEQKMGEHGGTENAGRYHRTDLLRQAAAALAQQAQPDHEECHARMKELSDKRDEWRARAESTFDELLAQPAQPRCGHVHPATGEPFTCGHLWWKAGHYVADTRPDGWCDGPAQQAQPLTDEMIEERANHLSGEGEFANGTERTRYKHGAKWARDFRAPTPKRELVEAAYAWPKRCPHVTDGSIIVYCARCKDEREARIVALYVAQESRWKPTSCGHCGKAIYRRDNPPTWYHEDTLSAYCDLGNGGSSRAIPAQVTQPTCDFCKSTPCLKMAACYNAAERRR